MSDDGRPATGDERRDLAGDDFTEELANGQREADAVSDSADGERDGRSRDRLSKDTAYSPASETETQRKQDDPLPETLDDDIDLDQVRAVPGTGGPDDVGDVDVDPGEINLPGRDT